MSSQDYSEIQAGHLLAECLVREGVRHVFTVPGESFLGVLDGFYSLQDQVRLIACRHEGGAAYMAEAYGKVTGKPGIVFASRGPGACNASIAVHTAAQDSTPMILFLGQASRAFAGREAFQEIDVSALFGSMAKWATTINDAKRIPEFVRRAFHVCQSGRPGPVVLALPQDMLTEMVARSFPTVAPLVHPAPSDVDLAQFHRLLERAKRPLLLVGGSGWTSNAIASLRRFAEHHDVPVCTAFRRQDLFNNQHPHYAGDVGLAINPRLAERLLHCDLLIALGTRLNEITTGQYQRLGTGGHGPALVHVYPDAHELNKIFQAHLPILASVTTMTAAMEKISVTAASRENGWAAAAHKDYAAFSKPDVKDCAVNLSEIMRYLCEKLPADAIIAHGAGNYAAWIHRYYQFRDFPTQLAPINGSMGYGVPAAVAAKLAAPHKAVVSISGDGCFMMNCQEILTAVQCGLRIIFVVINNGMYGTIRMHQERKFPGRISATDLKNPDFIAFAQSCGLAARRVTKTSEFAAAFDWAYHAGASTLIEIQTDQNIISPSTTIQDIHAQVRAPKSPASPSGRRSQRKTI